MHFVSVKSLHVWQLPGIYTILVSYNLFLYNNTFVFSEPPLRCTLTNINARTHTHTSKSSSALYRLFLYPTAHNTHATCFTCPSAPYSRILNIFIHIQSLFWCLSLWVYLPVSMVSIHPLWNFYAIFNTTLYPTLRLVNFVPVLFVMNYKLTRNAVYLSSLSRKEESKWRWPNSKARISNLISGTFKFRISVLKS